jgi:hypothetical protein
VRDDAGAEVRRTPQVTRRHIAKTASIQQAPRFPRAVTSLFYTVSPRSQYWMDASALASNNLTYARRISYRQIERRVRSIYVGAQVLGVRS